jgi:hypothetical protein
MGKLSTTVHVSLSVRDALHWRDSQLKHLFKVGRNFASPAEARDLLLDQLSDGAEFIRIGNECDNFDPKVGCLGHPLIEEPGP